MQPNKTILSDLLQDYANTNKPISVNFRKIVPHFTHADRATHLLHHYPAKLLMHIPYLFLSDPHFSNPGDIIMDPFSGSGTVLLEALLAERKPIGADANPFARLLSKVKTTPINTNLLSYEIDSFINDIQKTPEEAKPDVVNLDYWFYPSIINQLQCIKEAIYRTKNQEVQDFLKICFSNCVRKVSLADPRISVPVRLRPEKYPESHHLRHQTATHLQELQSLNVLNKLKEIIERNALRLKTIEHLIASRNLPDVLAFDAKYLTTPQNNLSGFEITNKIERNSVQLIITSPPYPGAQKYIRSCSLSLGWLDLCDSDKLRQLKGKIIGREEVRKHEYTSLSSSDITDADNCLQKIFYKSPKRAAIASYYLTEMQKTLKEMYLVLKPGGFLVLVAANNKIAETKFKTVEYLQTLACDLGFEVILKLIDDIHSRGLMTKRNKTANIITREWILVFRKRV